MEKKSTSHMDSFHVLHKVPAGDSPYTRAKHVQLVDKDPCKAISLFWSAINTGDRVDSALKDMAVVMKQLNRAEEAVEAIKSFRHLCSHQAQEALDNVLLDLYKVRKMSKYVQRCGRTDDQIELLQYKLKLIEEGQAFGGRRTKIARSQGKKFHVSIDQEKSRLLGNLAWAYIQKDDYQSAEALYRKALSIEPDNNKKCNLAICLIKTGRIAEARFLLQRIGPSVLESNMTDSYIKSYERACELLVEIESQLVPNTDKVGKQADVDELNNIKPAESAVPARNSGTTPPPPIQRDSLLTLVDGNLTCMSEMSAMDRSGWTDHREEKRAAFVNNPVICITINCRKFKSKVNWKAKCPDVQRRTCSKEIGN
ncbi:protein POLLENLESS 3-LIKE 2 [Cinnamomum micranthum f. kanehirae]|uniref:Protein POLLENLESS 3-LIKE 2 n=1 Tax=Cinnamomum micranthum f. kanehirae TaxID=337451 RepID=A0A3S3NE19_9MAGN|nr:protein POLLENLESS 3-LIKE 2 [Cinnamomum micranthum f. kanehirae]